MKTIPSSAAILVAGLALFAASTAEEVDFSLPPKTGLKFKVTSTASGSGSQTMTFGERETEVTSSNSSKRVFTETMLEVKDGKITKLERAYEDHALTLKIAIGDQERDPMEQENPLAWKSVRVSWDEDDAATVTVKEDDEWTTPEDALKKAVNPKSWRRGPVPLPKLAKKVGDTWEITGDEARKLFPISRRPSPGGEEPDPPEVTAKFEFVSIATIREMKCAVLKLNLAIESETMKRTSEMTCYYSVDHHIIVGMEGESTTTGERERETPNGTMTMKSSGTSKQKVEIVVLAAGAEG